MADGFEPHGLFDLGVQPGVHATLMTVEEEVYPGCAGWVGTWEGNTGYPARARLRLILRSRVQSEVQIQVQIQGPDTGPRLALTGPRPASKNPISNIYRF